MLATVSTTSLTRIAETVGNWRDTALANGLSSAAGIDKVAMKLCGALSSAPGEKTMMKLKPIVSQLISRSDAILASMSRPRIEMVMLSPTLSPTERAASISSETRGGP